ncbi:hypothetical protein MT418_000851 [Batrachochytrium dendrobatidis]
MSYNPPSETQNVSLIDQVIKVLSQSTNISLLTQYCQSVHIPTPLWSESSTVIGTGMYSYNITMIIQGLKFHVADVSSKLNGRKVIAQAAVDYFFKEQNPFFVENRHPGFVPLLGIFCQAIKAPTPKFSYTQTTGFLAEVFIFKSYMTTTPRLRKQQAKEDAAEIAFREMVDEPSIGYVFMRDFYLLSSVDASAKVSIEALETTTDSVAFQAESLNFNAVAKPVLQQIPHQVSHVSLLAKLVANDPKNGRPIYNYRAISEPKCGKTVYISQLIVKGIMFLSKETHYIQSQAAEEVSKEALKQLFPDEYNFDANRFMVSDASLAKMTTDTSPSKIGIEKNQDKGAQVFQPPFSKYLNSSLDSQTKHTLSPTVKNVFM